jgi:hypothetical protein
LLADAISISLHLLLFLKIQSHIVLSNSILLRSRAGLGVINTIKASIVFDTKNSHKIISAGLLFNKTKKINRNRIRWNAHIP